MKQVAVAPDDSRIEITRSQVLELRGRGHQAASKPPLPSLKLDSWPGAPTSEHRRTFLEM